MKRFMILRILIFLLGFIALIMAVPLILAAVYGEDDMVRGFAITMGPVLLAALPLVIFTRKQEIRFSASDGFFLVFLAWIAVCLLGAAPYLISGRLPRFSDAVFESASGFTTTGATVLSAPEDMPRSLLFWRAMTHWLGGMGIVVFTVALLPLLGTGGVQLLRAEITGPEKEKITPRITGAAKILWIFYIALTALQSLLLMAGGMDWFNAVTHAFSTMATGGFSSRNGGIAACGSPWAEWVCLVFMILAGFNFTLFYRLFQGKYREFLDNSEAKAYGGIILVSAGLIAFSLYTSGAPGGQILRQSSFQAVSILTSTGFSAADHTRWPPLGQAVLFFLMFVGGCSGSTAGGIKVIRHVVLFKQAGNEMKRLIYPKGVFNIHLNKRVGRKDAVYGVAAFVFLYMVFVFAAALLVSTAGMDLFSSLNIALITLGNIGLGLGKIGPDFVFYPLPGYIKWALSLVMIAGRLELWTVLVFFSRDYWRR